MWQLTTEVVSASRSSSAMGLFGSFRFDLPIGAAGVVAFGGALLLGCLARAVLARRLNAASRGRSPR